jgi:hypothetical protein
VNLFIGRGSSWYKHYFSGPSLGKKSGYTAVRTHGSKHRALNDCVETNKELGTTWNKAVLTCLSALYRTLEGGTGVNDEYQSKHLVSLPRLKPGHVHNTSLRDHRLTKAKNEVQFESNRLIKADEI